MVDYEAIFGVLLVYSTSPRLLCLLVNLEMCVFHKQGMVGLTMFGIACANENPRKNRIGRNVQCMCKV